MTNPVSTMNHDDAKPMASMEEISKFQARRRWAKVAWVYSALLLVATVMLGTFVVAFLASLKDDPLEQPFKFNFAQVQPSNWGAAYQLGKEGNDAPMFGGFAPGAEVNFTVTYAVEDGKALATPEIEVPRRRPGTGMAAAIVTDFAADYAQVSEPVLVDTNDNVTFVEKRGRRELTKQGHSQTWAFSIKYQGQGPEIATLPLTVEAPRGQVLIDSTLAPSKMERRGRVAAWDNAAPGVIGYVFKSYVRVYTESVSLDTGKSLFMSWTINSFFIAIGKVILTLFFACTAGYALARLKFTGARAVFAFMLFSMMIPGQVTFISNYLIYKDIGLLNTPWAVITAVVASGQVLIMKQFFENIPKELEEAAIVDGASPAVILWKVFMPLAKPAILSVTILGFQGAWNDFFWPLVVINSPADAFTLPVGLLSLRNAYGVAGDWNLILAGAFLSTIPVLIVFMVFQRYFVGNDISSAVKG
ncbi:ABC transmembrane type-1 domain-containing protein [Vibrio owensii]|uniref:ABC transmembrane type-1 domain-containing protein n=1 Tax=Vibrio owensii TaxID=696485 RepID=A0AAU9Q9U3_9VIBR|nr:carbohydrate ABC transporter permease [Vibrio sp. B1ASS3]CAH1537579.1 ABC transmembrane type-1 domain-containing protein [Vibrio owensii]HDM8223437.1 carbohydrate ABC transporter permease [Vibrio campbellii]CAD7827956.1 Binding-protein-dependent transport system inner membrane component [Vibrio sp. B1ASS3]CAE6967005.1 Binding-protein-dependent transport system inner membrane component [Vibrio sp. B1ASS3]HDM8244805.1 carbohydrate ABC transporter permease [Vibrio campbellii]